MSATSFIPFTGIAAIILTMTMGPADAAIGYDCETTIQNKTISLIDIIDIDYCDLAIKVNTSTVDIAVLQLNEIGNTTVLQCKIEIRRVIYNCGRQSNKSLVTNSTREYIYPISRKECEIAHNYGMMKIGNMIIEGLSEDATTTRNITLAGSVDTTGACIGANYSDHYGTWNNVVVTGTVKITLQTGLAEVNVENDTIYLPSGSQCKLSKEQCIDSDGGFTFRDRLPLRLCNRHTYSILYKGSATKLRDEETVYSVIVDDTRFGFRTVGTESSCGATLLKTESPKLFIIESYDLERLEKSNVVDNRTNNFDIFQYKNAQFIYVEPSGMRYPAIYVYRNVIEHKCKREKNFLKSILAVASTQPDEFAYEYMGGPGYTAVMDEYSICIVQCVPVEVKLEQMDKCYNRLPILRGSRRLFLTPKTHIITNNATELSCDSLVPVQTSPDPKGNITSVLDRVESAKSQWFETWNTFTVSIVLFVVFFGILVCIYIMYRQGVYRSLCKYVESRKQTESNEHDATIIFKKQQDV